MNIFAIITSLIVATSLCYNLSILIETSNEPLHLAISTTSCLMMLLAVPLCLILQKLLPDEKFPHKDKIDGGFMVMAFLSGLSFFVGWVTLLIKFYITMKESDQLFLGLLAIVMIHLIPALIYLGTQRSTDAETS